ncbi:AAA family ATPase [Spongiivirga citrea]|uniref:AAA family ATPase n=1 Tax=Spongiivirga citrea TaxID=1481457 RepID=A0A6M0CNG5_9FLAO|nr:ATP-binding protein [Spongiivirga citrea]NER16997.1 AAA family ATPase [Spongiivirga citrea]
MEEKLKQRPSNIIKVVLFGPESTGKTTLAQQLAKHYKEPWVAEYAREYLQEKWNRTKQVCQPEDLLPIAVGQIAEENKWTEHANNILFCDTDLLETKVYSEAYYVGSCDPLLEKYALANTYDLYLLTYVDTPWVADDLRDKPDERERMFEYFKESLEINSKPYILLKGNKTERFNTAVKEIDLLLNEKINAETYRSG